MLPGRRILPESDSWQVESLPWSLSGNPNSSIWYNNNMCELALSVGGFGGSAGGRMVKDRQKECLGMLLLCGQRCRLFSVSPCLVRVLPFVTQEHACWSSEARSPCTRVHMSHSFNAGRYISSCVLTSSIFCSFQTLSHTYSSWRDLLNPPGALLTQDLLPQVTTGLCQTRSPPLIDKLRL